MTTKATPHLDAALKYKSRVGRNCIQRSAALMLDLNGAEMVFGLFPAADPEQKDNEPDASPVPFIHAWVEWRGEVYAPTLMERTNMELRAFPKDLYYDANRVQRTWRLGSAAFNAVARRHGLSAAFKHQKPRAGSGIIADALLKAAGVQYVTSEFNTILPAPHLLQTA